MGRPLTIAALALAAGCNPAPDMPFQQVGYRDNTDPGPSSGERGTVVISEVLWSGTIDAAGTRDQSDIFIELRNEGARPVNVSQWLLRIEGPIERTWRIPDSDTLIDVGAHATIAAKSDGCILNPDFVIEGMALPDGDAFEITLQDADERLIESAGSETQYPYAGGFDGVDSRSMERVQLMFGGRGTDPHMWHFYTRAEVDVPNDTNVNPACREHTLASPGLPNSPDYSGAYATGSLE